MRKDQKSLNSIDLNRYQIPTFMTINKERPEWQMLIKEELNPNLNSFALQLILDRIRKAYASRIFSMESAVDQLHHECLKNSELFRNDLEIIFGLDRSKVTDEGID